jgi:hypothetical protein
MGVDVVPLASLPCPLGGKDLDSPVEVVVVVCG